jgi:hypothetical protein
MRYIRAKTPFFLLKFAFYYVSSRPPFRGGVYFILLRPALNMKFSCLFYALLLGLYELKNYNFRGGDRTVAEDLAPGKGAVLAKMGRLCPVTKENE